MLTQTGQGLFNIIMLAGAAVSAGMLAGSVWAGIGTWCVGYLALYIGLNR